jgi:hypothetical protein
VITQHRQSETLRACGARGVITHDSQARTIFCLARSNIVSSTVSFDTNR